MHHMLEFKIPKKWTRMLANDYSTLKHDPSLSTKMSRHRLDTLADTRWHQQNGMGANYTDKNTVPTKDIYQGCARGGTHQYPTNQQFVRSTTAHNPDLHLIADACTYDSVDSSGLPCLN